MIDTYGPLEALLSSVAKLNDIHSYVCPKGIDPTTQAQRLDVQGLIYSVNAPLEESLQNVTRLKEHKELGQLPLLILTSFGLESQQKRLKSLGFKQILLKPFPLEKCEKFFKEMV